VGEWDGTPQASQFAPTSRGLDALFDRLARVEVLLRQLTGANILSAADVFASKTGLTIAGELLVTGAMRVQGTLSLPAGIIDNDALAQPVVPSAFNSSSSGFAMGGAWETKAQVALAVPDGFSRAVVLANSAARVANTSGLAARSVWGRTVIGGFAGFQTETAGVNASIIGSVTSNHTMLLTGLTAGAQLVVATQVFTSAAWAADVNNSAGVNGVVFWLR
jgi:hypothetical protein